MLPQIIDKIKTTPKNPGVYIFYHNRQPLYVGKASSLKNRLQSYLRIIDFKTEALHKETTDLKLLKLHSNIEALIIESQLIKKLKPRYNVLWRDDKNYFFVEITKDKFPRIYITHQPSSIKRSAVREKNKNTLNANRYTLKADTIGPFTDGNSLKAILRLLRRFFPYCACKPHLRICLNSQINNCPGYCCNKKATPTKQEIAAYRKNIRKIRNILTGKNKKFIRQLKDPYELLVLEKIWEHEPYLTDTKLQILSESTNKSLLKSSKKFVDSHAFVDWDRVECYDNSHLSGKEAVGAMTVWKKENNTWAADKNSWRKFKIRGNYTEDDPRMMEEIVSRRLNHLEWPYPDLIIIDGGITQFNAVLRSLNKLKVKSLELKVISFAKPEQKIYGLEKNPVLISNLPQEFQNLIKRAVQNTHNFVIRYHRKVRRSQFLKFE